MRTTDAVAEICAVPAKQRATLRLTNTPPHPIPQRLIKDVARVITHQRSRILHPETKSQVFGFVPPLRSITGLASYLPIYLPYGRQSLAGNGMGALHSWGGHQEDIKRLGGQSKEDTALLVASVIREGTEVFFEPTNNGKVKIVAYRPKVGTVVLGYSPRGPNPHWFVITAHSGKGHLGDPVGKISKQCPVA